MQNFFSFKDAFRPKLFTAMRGYTKERFLQDAIAGIIVGVVAILRAAESARNKALRCSRLSLRCFFTSAPHEASTARRAIIKHNFILFIIAKLRIKIL